MYQGIGSATYRRQSAAPTVTRDVRLVNRALWQRAPLAEVPIILRRAINMRTTVLVIALSTALAPLGAQTSTQSRLADSLYAAKDYAKALTVYAQLAQGAGNVAAIYNVGAMHARLGHTDSAFIWLSRAVNSGLNNPALLRSDDDLASIRGDARFATLLAGPATPPMPCANAPDNRAFDFWAGDWDVTTLGGTPVGKSSVQVVSGGCALLENWTAANGGNGKSLSSYNAIEKRWQQYWVGSGGGVTEYRDSEWIGRSLSFIAHPPAGGAPPTAIVKLTFSAMPDGAVRQHGEQSLDQGTSWSTTYDFYYHRRQ
jgi:hypothetical protein